MKNLTKTLVGTVAAGAMAVSAATPALAKDRSGGIGAGEVIVGALIVGGIAAIAASSGKDKRDSYGYGRDRRSRDGYRSGRDNRSGRNYRSHPQKAVQRCINAAERKASRYGYGRANVTQVTKVSHKNGGMNVKGRIVVKSRYNGARHRGYDEGKFSCKVRYGRIAALKYSGIRGVY